MKSQLLQTKFYIPSVRSGLVLRPRLIARLCTGLNRKLTLVSAPAGSGKTTLVSEWVNHLRFTNDASFVADSRTDTAGESQLVNRQSKIVNKVAWLSLDGDDDDAQRFWTYLIAALQIAQEGLGQDGLRLLQGPQLPPVQSILTLVLNDLAALPEKIVLVLDDYHVISKSTIHEGLTFLLDHQPPQLHLVIATRADPPLPTARLRARRQITEVRARDLRFTPSEARTYLNELMQLDLEASDVAALEARTEGWIVGLQLAALSMQGRTDPHAFIEAFSGSHHYILEYLTEEVVHRQPEAVRRFLLQTSILGRLCGPLCAAIVAEGKTSLQNTEGSDVLTYLDRANLFIVPLDDKHYWYRYHHLFADLLGNLLRKEMSAEHIRVLHRRASVWYEENEFFEAAIDHALQARDFERAALLIGHVAQSFISQGRITTLVHWFAALPKALLHTRPRLCLYYGWALNLNGQIEAAEQIFLETRAILQGLPPSPEHKALRGQLAALLTGIATLHKDTATVLQEALEALRHLPLEDRLSRARVYMALGTAYVYQDKAEDALQTWQRGRDLALEADNPFLATANIEMMAGMQIYHQGRLRAGAQMLQQVLDLATTPDGRRQPFSGTSHALLAEIHMEWNDLDAARGYLTAGIDLLRQGGIGYGVVHTFCAKARLERALGNAEGARQALKTAEQALSASLLWHMIMHLISYQVRFRLWLGDVETAARWAEGDPSIIKHKIPEALPAYLREVRQISVARVHLARGETEAVLETLEGLEKQTQAAGRLVQAIEISMLKALAWDAQGKPDTALASFARSLAWAEPEGFVRFFLETGPGVIPLLHRAAARGIRPQYTDKLLTAFGVRDEESRPVTPSPEPQVLIEPLTPRERDVLALIGDGLSNREIAEKLVVTLNTVKKHSSHIYGKLGVRSRTQAVARAQALGLL